MTTSRMAFSSCSCCTRFSSALTRGSSACVQARRISVTGSIADERMKLMVIPPEAPCVSLEFRSGGLYLNEGVQHEHRSLDVFGDAHTARNGDAGSRHGPGERPHDRAAL